MEFRKSILENKIKNIKEKIADLELKISSNTVAMVLESLTRDLNSKKNELEELIIELKKIDPNSSLINQIDKKSNDDSNNVNEYSIAKDFQILGGSFNPEENLLFFRKLKIFETINNINMCTDEIPHSILIKNKKTSDEIEYLFEDIKSIKILDEKTSKSFLGTTLKGAGGFFLFGLVGLAAGVLSKKSNTQVILGVELSDENKIVITSKKDSKGYKAWEGNLMSKFEF